ncbi:helix-turn-helix domain-containing protein [Novosphingobium sp. PASSN1]|uniref:GlxA family transcriptional regulator n=1 Tax=Novosphingobium sp. PASSN1 TaxID=2015561 RepID=UPI000BD0B16F|nr:helix-turn-helix domain-containing protein [Novosphingobium sp. PASSN1]OYU33769.1 MAG: AraC family transcriptional regulator [Novosphingobium sp. PASSN1]
MIEFRSIIFVTYAGAELLDLAGPSAVFSTANRVAGKTLYKIVVATPRSGQVSHSCGIALSAVPFGEIDLGAHDTVLIVGADARPLAVAMADAELRSFLRSAILKAERLGSICTGAFILAAAGLLDGKTVATHWSATAQLGEMFPSVHCDVDALYVSDGQLWTSAGVSTGIDMALAIVGSDHGSALKAEVARQLVVYSHRPGHQSQFSNLLAAQAKEDERFVGLTTWLRESTESLISVEQMADHVGMSPRTFHRRFVESFKQTPAKFFEAVRLDAARNLLEARQSVANVARKAGFQSESAFRASFKARFGVTPQLYRETWHRR